MATTLTAAPRHRRAAATLLALVSALAGASCQGQPPTGPGSPPTSAQASPSASVDPAQAAATTIILKVFETYRATERAANDSGTERPAEELAKYLGDPLLARVVGGLYTNRSKGLYYIGTSTAVDPKVTQLDLAGSPPTATIETCVDNNNYKLVYRNNSSPVPVPSANRRLVALYTATRYEPQGWLITDSRSDRERTC